MNTIDTIDAVEIIETFVTVRFWKEAEHGAMRIGNTRVSLDSVYFHYMDGDSPEEIAEKFDGLPLSDIYGTIAYILENREEVEEYLRQGEIQAQKMRVFIEEQFGDKIKEFDERLRTRIAEFQETR